MKRKLRKSLSWLLTVAMIFSLFCGMIPTASAATNQITVQDDEGTVVATIEHEEPEGLNNYDLNVRIMLDGELVGETGSFETKAYGVNPFTVNATNSSWTYEGFELDRGTWVNGSLTLLKPYALNTLTLFYTTSADAGDEYVLVEKGSYDGQSNQSSILSIQAEKRNLSYEKSGKVIVTVDGEEKETIPVQFYTWGMSLDLDFDRSQYSFVSAQIGGVDYIYEDTIRSNAVYPGLSEDTIRINLASTPDGQYLVNGYLGTNEADEFNIFETHAYGEYLGGGSGTVNVYVSNVLMLTETGEVYAGANRYDFSFDQTAYTLDKFEVIGENGLSYYTYETLDELERDPLYIYDGFTMNVYLVPAENFTLNIDRRNMDGGIFNDIADSATLTWTYNGQNYTYTYEDSDWTLFNVKLPKDTRVTIHANMKDGYGCVGWWTGEATGMNTSLYTDTGFPAQMGYVIAGSYGVAKLDTVQLQSRADTVTLILRGASEETLPNFYQYTIEYYFVDEAENETKSQTTDTLYSVSEPNGATIQYRAASALAEYDSNREYTFDAEKTGSLLWTENNQVFKVYYKVSGGSVTPPSPGGEYDITKFEKTLVTSEPTNVEITLPSEDTVVKYPAAGTTVEVPVNGSVTLMYQFTVEGKVGTQFTISDEGATAVGGDYTSATTGSITGTIPENGPATIYAIKTFDVDDLDPVEGGTYALNNEATISVVGGGGSITDGEDEANESVPAKEGAPIATEDVLNRDLDNSFVTIHCTTAETSFGHEDKTYGLLLNGYIISNVTGDGSSTDPWEVTVTIPLDKAEVYVNAYEADNGSKEHTLNPGQETQAIVLNWDTTDKKWEVAPVSEAPVVYTVTCDDGHSLVNSTEFHIMHLNDIKQAVANAAGLTSADDVQVYSIYVKGTNGNSVAEATGGLETALWDTPYSGQPDKGVTGLNGMLLDSDAEYADRDAWKVLNTSDVIDDDSVTGITVYYKIAGNNSERSVVIPCTDFKLVEHLTVEIFGVEIPKHITQIWLDVEPDEPIDPDPEEPDAPTDQEIIDPEGILGDAIQLDCVNHAPETYNIAANTDGKNDSYKIGEVEGSAEAGYTCDITVYPLASYLKDYNTKHASVDGHTYYPKGQSDTITLVWVANGGSDGEGAWAVKDGKRATFAVECELVEDAPVPTYDQLKGLIGVQVVCDNQNHGEKTYELIKNSYSFTVTGNTAAVTVQSSAYVAQYNDPDKGFPGHQIVGDSTKTVTLTWDTEKESWYTAAGTATVEFQVSCDNSEKYIITAVAGENGSIAPEGQVPVKAGAQQDFTFTPDDGYAVDTVYVINNGESKTYVNNGTTQLTSWEGYSFTNVNSDGYITVTFAEDTDGDGIPDKYEYTLTYDANGGKFYPIGDTSGQDTYSVKKAAGTYTLAEELPEEVIGPMYSQPVDKGKVLFAGWTTEKPESDDVGRIYQAGDTDVPATITSVEIVNGDVTVFAVWGYDEDEDGVADINEVVITPADITIYTGGDGYGGVTNADGDIITNANNSGLPEPGYHIDLPANIQTWLGNGTTAENLATILRFEYNVEEGTAAGTRNWEMKYAGVYATDASGDPLRYVYTLEPSDDGNGKKIPVRILYKDGDTIVDDDKIEMSATAAHEEYTMTINPGELDQNKIQAKLTKGDESKTLNVFIGTGKLTIRSVVEKEDNTSVIAANESSVTGNEIAAVGNNASYVVNDSEVSIDVTNNADRVQLLVDKVSGNTEFDEAMENASRTRAGMSDGACETAYLDLVDTENGNTVVTLSRGSMDIYWPMPENANAEGTFKVVHYVGMDRESTVDTGDLPTLDSVQVLQGDKQVSVVTTGGQQYIKFSTDSFSPFALVYETKDPGTGPDTDPDDDKDDDDHYTGGGGNDNDSDPTGNLSIELDVNGGDDEFTFTVYFTDEDGDDLRNNFYFNGDFTGTIGSGDEITLEGGDKIVIRNLPEGTRYEVIIETADGYTYVIDGEEGIIRTGTNEAEFTATRTVPLADPSVTGVSRWLNVTDHIAYLTGYPGGAFGPDNSMTRAEVAQMFYALLNNKNVTITKTFPDVPANAWYATAVNTLASLGMVSGDANGNYRPNDPITRAEFCVIALAFAYEPDNAVCYFSDVSRSDWFYTYVAQAASYGWIGGYTNGNFGPNDRITRAQVTTIVNNMLGRAADRDYVIDHQADLVQFTDLNRTYWGYFQIMEATNAHDYTKSNGTENWR